MEDQILLGIIMVMILTNAANDGWNIVKISNKSYELIKKREDISRFNLKKLVDKLCDFEVEY
jgi:hypothetical protein